MCVFLCVCVYVRERVVWVDVGVGLGGCVYVTLQKHSFGRVSVCVRARERARASERASEQEASRESLSDAANSAQYSKKKNPTRQRVISRVRSADLTCTYTEKIKTEACRRQALVVAASASLSPYTYADVC
jgi:hypothetical protein